MKHVEYTPNGVCSRQIAFDIAGDNTIHNIHFLGGCSGNLQAIAKILEGYDANKVVSILKDNHCGSRPTSCADQLAQAIEKNL